MALSSSASSKHASIHHSDGDGEDGRFCDYTLRKVLSWLEARELLSSAALVSRRWAAASSCKEVWRRRMHQQVLDSLFAPQRQQRQQHHQAPLGKAAPGDAAPQADQQQLQQQLQDDEAAAADPLAAAAAALALARVGPARLFAEVYGGSLLANGAFLERLNVVRGRGLVWEPTFNTPRGMTWAHPFDFFPELSPLPDDDDDEDRARGSSSGGSSSRPNRAASKKPFSVGCLACATGAWSEVTQVVDLQAALTSRGVPAAAAAWLLGSAGLTLEFSTLVASGAMAGGEYQVVVSLVSAADAAAAAAADEPVPLCTLPRMTLPFGHPPAGSPGVAPVAAANLRQLGFREGSRTLSRAPLHPAPGVWSRFTCRAVLPTDAPISHVVVALRGRASRNSRLGHYATKFADARLRFLAADEC